MIKTLVRFIGGILDGDMQHLTPPLGEEYVHTFEHKHYVYRYDQDGTGAVRYYYKGERLVAPPSGEGEEVDETHGTS